MRDVTITDFDQPIAETAADQFIASRADLRIVHHVPGRLRVRISLEALKSPSSISVHALRNFVEGMAGVRSLRISGATLSAIIDYDPKSLSPCLWDHLFDGSDEVSRLAFVQLAKTVRAKEENSRDG